MHQARPRFSPFDTERETRWFFSHHKERHTITIIHYKQTTSRVDRNGIRPRGCGQRHIQKPQVSTIGIKNVYAALKTVANQ